MADVVGYSRLMGSDEEGTLAALKAHRNVVDPMVYSHGGRIVKTTGDGVFLDFPTVVATVRVSIEAQRIMAERNALLPAERRMLFRFGIHLGEVMVDGDDLFGDTVNVAARLQEVADPGGIALSGAARNTAYQQIEPVMIELGPQQLKNIAEPVRGLADRHGGRGTFGSPGGRGAAAAGAFGDRGSAVRQHVERSRAEFFADGIAEDVITALSRSVRDRPQFQLFLHRHLAGYSRRRPGTRRALRRRGQCP